MENCADSITSVLGNLDGMIKSAVIHTPIQKAVVEYTTVSSASSSSSSDIISVKFLRRKIEDLGFKLIAYEVKKQTGYTYLVFIKSPLLLTLDISS